MTDRSIGERIDVSIVIPSKNGSATIDRVLSAIEKQVSWPKREVLVVDSGSTDGTVEIARKRGARVHEISPGEFSHSRTRNLGARLAKADRYLVFLNQDAVPVDSQWLECLLRPFAEDPEIKGVSGIELDPMARHPFNVAGIGRCAVQNSLVNGTYLMSRELLPLAAELPKAMARRLYLFTTVCAAFDRPYFDDHPFDPSVEYGEDLHWAVTAVDSGVKVACATGARVYHDQARSDRELFRRLRLDIKLGEEVFGEGYQSRLGKLAWALGIHRVEHLVQKSLNRLVSWTRGY